MKPTRDMSDRHEQDLVATLGGQRTRNSGAVWVDQSDGHQAMEDGYYRFAWDGKSTLGKSIGVSREMWAKAVVQSRNLDTLLPLRFYGDARLTSVEYDLVVLDLDLFARLLADANRFQAAKAGGCLTGDHMFVGDSICSVCGVSGYDIGDDSP